MTPPPRRQEMWKLALNLSATAAVGGIAFIVVGAWIAGGITSVLGALCAAATALLLRRRGPGYPPEDRRIPPPRPPLGSAY